MNNKILQEIKGRKNAVKKLWFLLDKNDKKDYYWKTKLEHSKKNDFFDTHMIISWIGKKIKPKNILEIGTRNGGSLIALLSTYTSFKDVKIYSFDMWREYHTFSIMPKPIAWCLPGFIKQYLSIKRVKRNLNLFNIPTNCIKFISGDSKITIPNFFKENQSKKFDYILVDGGHDKLTAYTDLKNVAKHVTNNGFIVFDDIGPNSYKLIDIWEKFKKENKTTYDFYEILHGNGIAWAIKKSDEKITK